MTSEIFFVFIFIQQTIYLIEIKIQQPVEFFTVVVVVVVVVVFILFQFNFTIASIEINLNRMISEMNY